MLTLSVLAGEPELADPRHAGEWAGALDGLPPASPPWCFYFVREGGRAVGSGGFKGPPDADGRVEIAYLSFLGARRSGVATRLAAHLVALAREHGAAGVLAHTLRAHGPSTRVLRANGFAGPADADDPGDGPVWRWELAF